MWERIGQSKGARAREAQKDNSMQKALKHIKPPPLPPQLELEAKSGSLSDEDNVDKSARALNEAYGRVKSAVIEKAIIK